VAPPPSWRSLPLLRAEGTVQMHLDVSLAHRVGKGDLPPLLRFFQWDPPALSLGYSQDVGRDVNLQACHDADIALVTRPTGGKAVLHREELSYSLLLPRARCPGLREVYARTGEAVGRALQMLGGDVSWGRIPAGHDVTETEEPLCFWAASPGDVYIRGKKLTGVAQRRWRDVLLIQGSLLLDFHPETVLPLLRWRTVERAADLRARVGSVRECLGTLPPVRDILTALRRGVEGAWGVFAQEGEFPPPEGEKAEVTVGYP